MDPIEGMKWAAAITAALGGGAFGIKRLLTIWGKETAQSNGVAASNNVIEHLRKEIEATRQTANYFSKENSDAQIRIAELQKQVTHLMDANHKLALNNKYLKEFIDMRKDKEVNKGVEPMPTFSQSNIGDLRP